MLEFWIDPDSLIIKNILIRIKLIFFCASAWRLAVVAKVAMEMGLSLVVHLEVGFNEWLKQGGAIETIHKK